MKKEKKLVRSLKVLEQGGFQRRATPTVMLKGKWLEELGFEIGCQVQVHCENGRLTITLAETSCMKDELKYVAEENHYERGTK